MRANTKISGEGKKQRAPGAMNYYKCSRQTLDRLATAARARYKYGKSVWYDTERIDRYLQEQCAD